MASRATLRLGDAGDREDAGAFVARAVRMDGQALIRLRNAIARTAPTSTDRPAPRVHLWGSTPFDTLVTRSVGGAVEPSDVTVHAANLLPGIAVARDADIDPGPSVDALWRSPLPPPAGWVQVDVVPAEAIADLAALGTERARESASPAGGTASSLLDSTVLTVSGSGFTVTVPMRCLFAFAGMGFGGTREVRVFATDAWLRLDGEFGAAVRRRHALLPLLF